MTQIQEPFVGKTTAPDSDEVNWLLDYENLSVRDAAWCNLERQRAKLVGELWRERLSSEPWHAEKAQALEARTGDPMAYWNSFYEMRPGSVTRRWAGESSTAAALFDQIQELQLRQQELPATSAEMLAQMGQQEPMLA